MAIKSIARVQTDDRTINQLQSNIITAVNPVLENPISNGIILPNVALTSGSNTIDHKLSRKLQGWIIVRQRGLSSIYDNQDSNNTADKTLVLISNSNVTIDLYVF